MKDGTQRLKTFQKNMKQAFHPMTTISKISYKILYSSCALAGQTGGAIRLSLIFLFLFPSREKERRSERIRKIIFLLCSFGLNQKNQKFKPKTNAPLFLAGQRTWTNIKIVNTM